MRIEHVAMYVNDLEEMKDFYVKFFEATANEKYQNFLTGLETYFLTFQGNSRLEIMTRPEVKVGEKSVIQNGYTHLAFSVGSKEKVDKLTEDLAKAGYKVISGPRRTGDGYYESCVLDPEHNQIEITE